MKKIISLSDQARWGQWAKKSSACFDDIRLFFDALNVSGQYDADKQTFIPQSDSKLDVLVIFGSNDLAVPKHAASVLEQHFKNYGYYPIVYVSGKGGHRTTPGPGIPADSTEAEVFAAYIRNHFGKDAASLDIRTDCTATNSGANVLNAAEKVPELIDPESKVVGIIQTPLDQLRAILTAHKQGVGHSDPAKRWTNATLIALGVATDTYLADNSADDQQVYVLTYVLRALLTLQEYGHDGRFVSPYTISPLIVHKAVSLLQKLSGENSEFSDIDPNCPKPEQIQSLNRYARNRFEEMDRLHAVLFSK